MKECCVFVEIYGLGMAKYWLLNRASILFCSAGLILMDKTRNKLHVFSFLFWTPEADQTHEFILIVLLKIKSFLAHEGINLKTLYFFYTCWHKIWVLIRVCFGWHPTSWWLLHVPTVLKSEDCICVFLGSWEQAVIIWLNTINWLFFASGTEGVWRAVRPPSVNVT
jgi:hypothetical protein